MLAYTGKYKGKEITVFPSGMGMPSIGIYCYELFQFYDVECIIRLGSCGVFVPDIELLDTILVENSYTDGNFARNLANEDCHFCEADKNLTNLLEATANEENLKIIKGNTYCSEVFDYYIKDFEEYKSRFPQDLHLIASEMEAFALFYTAKYLNKKAACLLTVVDSRYKDEVISSEKRETSLNTMIVVALDTAIKL